MKSTRNPFTLGIVLIFLAAYLVGCAGPRSSFPLRPGEKIIFESGERAAEFRRLTGDESDPATISTGRVVTVPQNVILQTF